MSGVANDIARLALAHYDRLPQRGKPQSNEWTVYAAIVAAETVIETSHDATHAMRVVCCATGTKCTSAYQSGLVMHDCHAEVLCRRGLVHVMWNEIQSDLDATSESTRAVPQRCLLQRTECGSIQWVLKPSIQLYLYVSDCPCGDASIYAFDVDHIRDQFTGAKVIVLQAPASTADPDSDKLGLRLEHHQRNANNNVAREPGEQALNRLRLKSGRSDIAADRRSTSLSCSDKLVRWQVLGWQSGPQYAYLRQPIRLHGIVISRDARASVAAQQVALHRAISSRVRSTQTMLQQVNDKWIQTFATDLKEPEIFLTEMIFAQGKAANSVKKCASHDAAKNDQDAKTALAVAGKKRARAAMLDPASPCGMAIAWQAHAGCTDGNEGRDTHSDTISVNLCEYIVSARGCLQGKWPRSHADWRARASRLCRASLARQAIQAAKTAAAAAAIANPSADAIKWSGGASYADWKRAATPAAWRRVRDIVLTQAGGPLAGWLVNEQDGDFPL